MNQAARWLAMLTLILGLAGAPARGAGLPDWAASLASEEMPAEFDDADYVTLLHEQRIVVAPDGTLKVERRIVRRAQAEEPEGMNVAYFPYASATGRVERTRGWLSQGGKVKATVKKGIDQGGGTSFLDDSLVHILSLPAAQSESVAAFEFELSQSPFTLSHAVFFGALGAPIRTQRLILEMSPGWIPGYDWVLMEGPEPTVDGQTWTWEVFDQFPDDPQGQLYLNFIPDGSSSIPVISNWDAFGRWYEELARGREAPTAEVRTRSSKLAAGSPGNFLATVERAGRFVRDSVRYVDIELGIQGYQPRAAGVVLERLYGDCKDKGTLFRSLLGAAGIDSHAILVNATRRGTVSRNVPHPGAFNHFVVGVPVPASVDIPEAYRPALVDAGPLGDLLLVDTTNEYASIGSIPAYLGGKTVYVVAGSDGTLVDIPESLPEAHRLESHLVLDMAADPWTFRFTRTFRGEFAAVARALSRSSPAEFETRSRRDLGGLLAGMTLEDWSVVEEDTEGAFIERTSGTVSPSGRLPLFSAAQGVLSPMSLARRTEAVDYEYPMVVKVQTEITGLPTGLRLPLGRDLSGEGWTVTTHYVGGEAATTATWEATLRQSSYEPESFAELKSLWSAVRQTAGLSLTLD